MHRIEPLSAESCRRPPFWSGPALLLFLVCFAVPAVAAGSKAVELTENALRLMHGEGVEQDVNHALVYLCAAAGKGYGPAAYELAWLYLQGRGGIARDDDLGAAWLRESVRLGEKPPPRLMAGLASSRKRGLACVSSNGRDLRPNTLRRTTLMIKIHELAPKFGLDPALVLEVVRMESNFNPRARSHKGALGLMQLIPSTARRFGVKDPFDPVQNLRGGMAYLSWLLERFDGDLSLTLAGYNAGEAAVEQHGGVPPYQETRTYVGTILARYNGDART